MGNLPKNDKLGDRMKSQYEDRSRFFLPRRTYTILRVDGRAFHTWTRGLKKPYDTQLMDCMDATAVALCKEIAGARFAYVQSDEISVLATDFADEGSQSWFDGNLQKWVSVAASVATMAFNEAVGNLKLLADPYVPEPILLKRSNATFDARVFTIPDYIEVENYFIWRQQDAARNSVSMLAQHYASAKKLHGKNNSEQQEIIHEAGDNWAKHPVRFKHGGVIRRTVSVDLLKVKQDVLDIISTKKLSEKAAAKLLAADPVARTKWELDQSTPSFTRNRDYLRYMIPRHWEGDESTKKASA
jgi:tRNA(His) guanylyltransferase